MTKYPDSMGDRPGPGGQDRGSRVLRNYLAEIRKYPLLSREEEGDLARDYLKGRGEAFNEIVRSNLPYVVRVAGQYRGMGMPFEDLIGEGNLGLIEAAKRYDVSTGNKFITYATWWIRKSILVALKRQARIVKVPGYQMRKIREVKDAVKYLREQLGEEPGAEKVAVRMAKSAGEIGEILQLDSRDVSLDEKVGKDNDRPLADYLADPMARDPQQSLIDREYVDRLYDAMTHMPPQELTVAVYRFGLHGEPAMTLQEIGNRMGVTRERVRQLETKAKERLRKVLTGNVIGMGFGKRITPMTREALHAYIMSHKDDGERDVSEELLLP